MTTTTTEILKQDRLGRVKEPRERREALLMEYDRSGMSGAAFARFAGVNYTTFASWRQKRQKKLKSAREGGEHELVAGQEVKWMEAVVGSAEASVGKGCGVLIVYGPCGVRMEVGDRNQAGLAAEMVRKLAGNGAMGC